MRRRKFLSVAALGALSGMSFVRAPGMKTVLTGGRYYDGTRWITGPVGISDDGTMQLLPSVPEGVQTIDVSGNIIGYDAANGKILWHAYLSNLVSNAPETYTLDGHQYLLVGAGDTVYSFILH